MRLDAAGIAGVPVIHLVGEFLPVSTTLSALMMMTLSPSSTCGVRRSACAAAQAVGDEGCEIAADDETFGVDQHPLLHHLRRLLREGFHVDFAFFEPSARWGEVARRFLLLGLAPDFRHQTNGGPRRPPSAGL